jgi:hypothetical protein
MVYGLAVTAVLVAMATAAVIPGQGTFSAGVMAWVAHVAAAVSGFVALEVVERFRTPLWNGSAIPAARVIAVIDVAEKAAWAAEPRACADEDAAVKPVGTVVAVGSAVVGSVVKVAVRAYRRFSNVDADRDLGRSAGSAYKQRYGKYRENKELGLSHKFSFNSLERLTRREDVRIHKNLRSERRYFPV